MMNIRRNIPLRQPVEGTDNMILPPLVPGSSQFVTTIKSPEDLHKPGLEYLNGAVYFAETSQDGGLPLLCPLKVPEEVPQNISISWSLQDDDTKVYRVPDIGIDFVFRKYKGSNVLFPLTPSRRTYDTAEKRIVSKWPTFYDCIRIVKNYLEKDKDFQCFTQSFSGTSDIHWTFRLVHPELWGNETKLYCVGAILINDKESKILTHREVSNIVFEFGLRTYPVVSGVNNLKYIREVLLADPTSWRFKIVYNKGQSCTYVTKDQSDVKGTEVSFFSLGKIAARYLKEKSPLRDFIESECKAVGCLQNENERTEAFQKIKIFEKRLAKTKEMINLAKCNAASVLSEEKTKFGIESRSQAEINSFRANLVNQNGSSVIRSLTFAMLKGESIPDFKLGKLFATGIFNGEQVIVD